MWQVFGFDANKIFFENALKSDSLSHAYLFTGQEMIGKKTFSLDLARLTLESDFDLTEKDPNLFFVSGDNSILIKKIREFKKFLSLKPYSGKYKFGIIDNAHLMTEDASNALLKSLEEPPPYSLIILITSNPEQLLPTIRSRCEEVRFHPHSRLQLLKFISELGLNRRQAEFLADFSNGRPGLAYNMKKEDSLKDIKKVLEVFNGLVKADINQRLDFSEKIFKDGETEKLKDMLLQWMFYLRSEISKRLEVNKSEVLKKMIETRYLLSKPQYNHRLAFESFLLSF